MGQIKYEKEVKTVINNRDEEAFGKILLIDKVVAKYFFVAVRLIEPSSVRYLSMWPW